MKIAKFRRVRCRAKGLPRQCETAGKITRSEGDTQNEPGSMATKETLTKKTMNQLGSKSRDSPNDFTVHIYKKHSLRLTSPLKSHMHPSKPLTSAR